MWKRFWDYIGKSVWSKAGGKISTTRIQSYMILASVLISTLLFLSIDLVNAIIKWKAGLSYAVPTEHITLFGMVLAHHLALLGINKNSETKQMANKPETKEEPKSEPQKKKEEPRKDEDVPPIQKDDTLDEEGEVH